MLMPAFETSRSSRPCAASTYLAIRSTDLQSETSHSSAIPPTFSAVYLFSAALRAATTDLPTGAGEGARCWADPAPASVTTDRRINRENRAVASDREERVAAHRLLLLVHDHVDRPVPARSIAPRRRSGQSR